MEHTPVEKKGDKKQEFYPMETTKGRPESFHHPQMPWTVRHVETKEQKCSNFRTFKSGSFSLPLKAWKAFFFFLFFQNILNFREHLSEGRYKAGSLSLHIVV